LSDYLLINKELTKNKRKKIYNKTPIQFQDKMKTSRFTVTKQKKN